ncbi:MAG TPA: type II secretion system protein GspC [Gammaproteobacteria bacterium]|nr:type II secretion system protein GspC [Gammaproteobacteria bacterium]
MSLRSGNFTAMIPYLLIAFLLLLIAAQLAKLTWTIFDNAKSLPGMSGSEAVSARNSSGKTTIDWNSIALFGKAEVVKKPAVKKPEIKKPKNPAALQKLDVTLIGVLLSSDPQNSYVSIREKGETRVLKSGAEIQEGVVVKTIQPRAFIASDGSAERIFYLIPADQLKASDREAEMLQEKQKPESTSFTDRKKAAAISYQVDEETKLKLAQYRSELQEDPLSLIDLVKVSPVQRNDELYGYRLRHGKDRKLLKSVGLRAGDIMLNINDHPITDPGELNGIMESVMSGSMINLRIERGGKPRDLNVVVE